MKKESEKNSGGWGWYNFWGTIGGVGQVVAGTAAMAGTGFLAAPAGAALVSSGMSSVMYSVSANNDEIQGDEYFKKAVVAGVIGVATVGVASGADCALSSSAKIVEKLGEKGITIVANAVGGAAGQMAGEAAEKIVEGKEPEIPSVSRAAIGAVGGGIGGYMFTRMPKLELFDGSIVKTPSWRDYFYSILKGAECGLITASATQMTGNLILRKEFFQGLREAALAGSITGASLSVLHVKQEERAAAAIAETKRNPSIKVSSAKLFPLSGRDQNSNQDSNSRQTAAGNSNSEKDKQNEKIIPRMS